MLTLSRKLGERLVIGNAVVVVKKLSGSRVTLGIEAPREVKIERKDKSAP